MARRIRRNDLSIAPLLNAARTAQRAIPTKNSVKMRPWAIRPHKFDSKKVYAKISEAWFFDMGGRTKKFEV